MTAKPTQLSEKSLNEWRGYALKHDRANVDLRPWIATIDALTDQVAKLKAENKEIDAMNTAYMAEVARVRAERDALKVAGNLLFERAKEYAPEATDEIEGHNAMMAAWRAALSPLKPQEGDDAEGE